MVVILSYRQRSLSNVPGVCEYFALWEGREGSYPFVYIEEVWYQHLFNSVWFASPSEYLTNNKVFIFSKITERRFVTTRLALNKLLSELVVSMSYQGISFNTRWSSVITMCRQKYDNRVWSFINHFCFKPVAICFKMVVGAPACPNRFA